MVGDLLADILSKSKDSLSNKLSSNFASYLMHRASTGSDTCKIVTFNYFFKNRDTKKLRKQKVTFFLVSLKKIFPIIVFYLKHDINVNFIYLE